MGTDADRIAWRAAGSLDDLLGLTADFLEGRRGFFPGWGGASTDEESDSLLPALRGALDHGLMTVASQPGAPSARATTVSPGAGARSSAASHWTTPARAGSRMRPWARGSSSSRRSPRRSRTGRRSSRACATGSLPRPRTRRPVAGAGDLRGAPRAGPVCGTGLAPAAVDRRPGVGPPRQTLRRARGPRPRILPGRQRTPARFVGIIEPPWIPKTRPRPRARHSRASPWPSASSGSPRARCTSSSTATRRTSRPR